MPRREVAFSGYRTMWLFAMFDLPVKTRRDKRNYVRFRNLLLDAGFCQMQFSVYARVCPTEEAAETYARRVRDQVPANGHVRLLAVTDRQFGKMEVYFGKKRLEVESEPTQLALF